MEALPDAPAPLQNYLPMVANVSGADRERALANEIATDQKVWKWFDNFVIKNNSEEKNLWKSAIS